MQELIKARMNCDINKTQLNIPIKTVFSKNENANEVKKLKQNISACKQQVTHTLEACEKNKCKTQLLSVNKPLS